MTDSERIANLEKQAEIRDKIIAQLVERLVLLERTVAHGSLADAVATGILKDAGLFPEKA